ncbi:MAG: hypothetical protein MK135_00970 [Polyangiaceae bacterium]|nr:hypothetical protein [Polyangiaceae bacterium]
MDPQDSSLLNSTSGSLPQEEENSEQSTRRISERAPQTSTRRYLLLVGLSMIAIVGVALTILRLSFPSDQLPEGAYLRVAKAVTNNDPASFFAYLEEPAQHACFTISRYRSDARRLIEETYPMEAAQKALKKLGEPILEGDGPAIFSSYAKTQGWVEQLRADLSGVKTTRVEGLRATIETVRGTRYSFRRRPNGIWGMTAFTASLLAEAEKSARDFELISRAATEYRRATPGK